MDIKSPKKMYTSFEDSKKTCWQASKPLSTWILYIVLIPPSTYLTWSYCASLNSPNNNIQPSLFHHYAYGAVSYVCMFCWYLRFTQSTRTEYDLGRYWTYDLSFLPPSRTLKPFIPSSFPLDLAHPNVHSLPLLFFLVRLPTHPPHISPACSVTVHNLSRT